MILVAASHLADPRKYRAYRLRNAKDSNLLGVNFLNLRPGDNNDRRRAAGIRFAGGPAIQSSTKNNQLT